MALTITAVQPGFVAQVSGLDLTEPLGMAEVGALERGMNEFAVLVFSGQAIDDKQQLAFTEYFGGSEGNTAGGHILKPSDDRLQKGMSDFSNLDKNGQIISATDRVWFFKLGDRLWHSDSSFRPNGAKYSLLSGRVIPSWGANTEFADMRAAYDHLDDRTKEEVEDLVCLHSLMFSREVIGFTELTPHEREAFKPVRQRLVRTHPVTGRKSLFLSSHAGEIEGWTVPEARSFLRDLTEHATQPQFVYAHHWKPHDLVMWDNRTTMHRGRRFDRNEVRDVRRTTVAGNTPTIEQVIAG